MLAAAVAAIGLVTPGMETWRDGRRVLRRDVAYQPLPLSKYRLELLPANERRRATPLIQLALRAIEDCLGSATALAAASESATPSTTDTAPTIDFKGLASVFACSGGDMGNLHTSCEQLARDPRGLSPTAFHNSVHNAVAGYWSIGGQARAPSVSICAHDGSFVAGLLEALALLSELAAPVLYVAYDAAVPVPLFAKRPVTPDFAVALLLGPVSDDEHGSILSIERADESGAHVAALPTAMAQTALETLRLGNPAARVLPLLRLFACAMPGRVLLADEDARWLVKYRPALTETEANDARPARLGRATS